MSLAFGEQMYTREKKKSNTDVQEQESSYQKNTTSVGSKGDRPTGVTPTWLVLCASSRQTECLTQLRRDANQRATT
jgi:hypothetical protein